MKHLIEQINEALTPIIIPMEKLLVMKSINIAPHEDFN